MCFKRYQYVCPIKTKQKTIMKNNLFIIMYIGFILCLVSIATTNIYLLGLSELIVIPTAIKLFILNFKKQN